MYGIPNISYRALSAYGVTKPVAAGNAVKAVTPEPHTLDTQPRQLKEDKKGGGGKYRLSHEPGEQVDISKEAMLLFSRIRP